jgi:hypothetical protein
MATTRFTGKNLYVKFVSTVLSTHGRNFEVTHEQEQADGTAGADDYRVFLNTVKNIGASMDIIMSSGSTGSAVIAALQPGAEGTLEFAPEGTVAGKPKWGFAARVSNSSMALPYDDVAMISVEWTNYGSALVYNGATAVY